MHYRILGVEIGVDREREGFGQKTKTPSGHFARHLDKAMGVDDDVQKHQAKLKVPTYARHLGERVIRDVSVLLVYKAINGEVKRGKSIRRRKARKWRAGGTLFFLRSSKGLPSVCRIQNLPVKRTPDVCTMGAPNRNRERGRERP